MSKKSKQNFFWVSYSDLMTSLFFIMLLLFVLASGGMFLEKMKSEKEKNATAAQLKKIEEIQKAVNQLPAQFFEEDEDNHRWTLKKEFSPVFNQRDANIYLLNDTTKLIKVGESLMEVIRQLNKLKSTDEYKDMDISYLVVIEGMASRDNYFDNDGLSYRRALSLYYLWKANGISFEQSQCEVQISGSGTRGIRPFNTEFYDAEKKGEPNAFSKFDINEEKRNQCIIIQIIPKISNI